MSLLAKLLQKNNSVLEKLAPKLRTLAGSVAGVAENFADGVNNVYEDYTYAK
jgi:hypothetical protein